MSRLFLLAGGGIAVVDDDDFELLSHLKWRRRLGRGSRTYYAIATIGSAKSIAMHRVIMKCTEGDGIQIDHKNGNGLDNRKCNLRFCTLSENMRNFPKSLNGHPIYKGVFKSRTSHKFEAKIGFNKQKFHLGTFSSDEEAARAYDRKAIELHGEFARLNFPRIEYL